MPLTLVLTTIVPPSQSQCQTSHSPPQLSPSSSVICLQCFFDFLWTHNGLILPPMFLTTPANPHCPLYPLDAVVRSLSTIPSINTRPVSLHGTCLGKPHPWLSSALPTMPAPVPSAAAGPSVQPHPPAGGSLVLAWLLFCLPLPLILPFFKTMVSHFLLLPQTLCSFYPRPPPFTRLMLPNSLR